jgi:hypothetical protein
MADVLVPTILDTPPILTHENTTATELQLYCGVNWQVA